MWSPSCFRATQSSNKTLKVGSVTDRVRDGPQDDLGVRAQQRGNWQQSAFDKKSTEETRLE